MAEERPRQARGPISALENAPELSNDPPKPPSPSRLKNVSRFLKRWLPPTPPSRDEEEGKTESTVIDDPSVATKSSPPLPWEPNGVATSYQPTNKNVPVSGMAEAPSGKETSTVFPKTCPPGNVDWNEYKSFLVKVWEENSLGSSSLEAESSTLPSLSSLSGEFPFAIDLLTTEKMFTEGEEPSSDPSAIDRSSPMAQGGSQTPPATSSSTSLRPTPPATAQEPSVTKAQENVTTRANFVLERGKLPLISIQKVFTKTPVDEAHPVPTKRPSLKSSLQADVQELSSGISRGSLKSSRSGFLRGNDHIPSCFSHRREIATIRRELEDANTRIQLLSAQVFNSRNLA